MIRKHLLLSLVVLTGLCFLGRLFYLQIIESESNSIETDNAIRKVYNYPKRGYIYDRNDKLLVANQPTYDIIVVPIEMEPIDTLLFCDLLNIKKDRFLKSISKAERY